MNKFTLIIYIGFCSIILFASSCKKSSVNDQDSDAIVPAVPNIVLTDPNITADSSSKSVFLYDQTNNTSYTTHKYQGCPSIGIDGNTYYAAWQTGGAGEQPGNYLTVAVSTDKGVNWKEHKLIITSSDSKVRHFDAMFWKDKNGELCLSWASSVGMWDGGDLGAWYVYIKYINNRVTISKPHFLFHGVMNTKPTPVGKDSSKMLFPMSGFIVPNPWNKYPTIPTPSDLAGANVYQSTYDANQELTTPVRIAKLNTSRLSLVFAEMNIVDMGGNAYQTTIRTETGIYIAKSADACASWSTPASFQDLGSSTGSRSFYGRLKSGNLIFVMNNSTTRNNLTAFLSTDNGKTWPSKLLIDSRDAVSYPDVMQDDAGNIIVVYDRERTGAQEINMLKLSEQDIINGVTGNSVVVVSHK